MSDRLAEETSRHAAESPGAPGLPLETARLRLGLPARRLVTALVRPPLRVEAGRVHGPAPGWAEAVERLRADLADAPFAAPSAERLAELGLTADALTEAERAGAVLRIPCDDGDIVLLPGAEQEALRVLSEQPQPFTPAQAGQALATGRGVAAALLRHLGGLGLTERRSS